MVVVLSPFLPHDSDRADVLLPIAPFTETSGTFVNAEGRVQSFHGVVKPLGEARPAWKVLRVLGNLLGLPGFSFETSEEVRADAIGDTATIASRLAAEVPADAKPVSLRRAAASGTLERIADVPIYATDPIVGRASLTLTVGTRRARLGVPSGSPPSSASSTAPVRVTGAGQCRPRRASIRRWPPTCCASPPVIR
jgi:NADH-quinone oxidoreductase subunit G